MNKLGNRSVKLLSLHLHYIGDLGDLEK